MGIKGILLTLLNIVISYVSTAQLSPQDPLYVVPNQSDIRSHPPRQYSGVDFNANAQTHEQFQRLKSLKNRYTIEIPSSFSARTIVGTNVEYSYDNSDHATIVMVVRPCLSCTESDVSAMSQLSYSEQAKIMEENGQVNVVIMKSNVSTINGRKTFAQFSKDETVGVKVYCESYTQIKDGKLFSLLLTCPNYLRNRYFSYFFHIKNSLTHI